MTATATRPRRPRKQTAKKYETRVKRGRTSGPYVIECKADALWQVRNFAGMTQAKLANATMLSTGMIGSLESGARTTCSLEVATRIAEQLQTPIKDLFTMRKLES